MSRPTPSFPPPADAAARYDAVVRRGHVLRRRQRLARGAGAGGAALALLLVVVLVARVGGASDDQPVADGPTSTSTSTTLDPTQMRVVVMADARAVAVKVDDPIQPVGPGAQVCVHVRLARQGAAGAAVAVGDACWTPAAGTDDTMSSLQLTNGVEVGCAAVVERDPSAPGTTAPAAPGATQAVHHAFSFSLPAGVPEARYVAEVTAVSGIGDGCDPAGPGEDEHLKTAKDGLTVP